MAEAADFQGTGSSPARRWLRRAAVLLAGTPLLAGLVYVPAASPAHAADSAGPQSVDVSLDTLTPAAPVEGDSLTISGTVVNRGKETITDARVGLRVGPPMTGRTAVDAAAERTGPAPGNLSEIDDEYTLEIAKLPSKIGHDFTIKVPVDKLGLDADGIYQVGVSLAGQTPSRPYPQVLGMERTFLPWQPESAEKRTQLTFVWPLISSTHLTSETGSDEQQTPVFQDDSLSAELAPGGRLEQLVSLGKELPVTWLIDPDLLATVDAMTRSYQVRGHDGTTVAGKSQDVAKQWLSSLEDAVEDQKVVALPFADPDLASLAHRGRNVSGSLSHLRPATEVAKQAVETILHVTPSTDFAWPVEGAVDPSVVNTATSAGAHHVIARSDSMRETGNLSYTPTAARPIGGGTTAVVADARLSTAFQRDMSRAGSSTLAVQEFLAQSLALNLQGTDEERSIVVAPQRMPTASQAQSMAGALHGLQSGRWTQPLDLEAAGKAKPDPDATTSVPGSGSYPDSLRKKELPRKAFEEIRTTQNTLDHFKVILTAEDRVDIPFGNAIRRGMSSSWRGKPQEAAQYRGDVQSYLIGLTKKVQLIPKSDATLSGRSATIPVTVQNSLVQGVDNLVLRLTSDKPNRLKFGDGAEAEQPVAVQGGHSQSVKFTANATASGPVEVTAQLYTEDGVRYGEARRFTVEATEITPTVMLVIAGGVLLLVLAGIRMYAHRRRAAARATAGATADTAAETAGETPEEADDAEQQSDPTPDTGPDSGNPSGTGEKVDR
ncbi:DUF6049 family protein [Streptomyces sp. A3M-1-3]|uniref:DUF6049 family protein n=1 Tax=Streptomyces sp. A3M-1-3 TaxID=2962044 RepID=UPI0020B69AEC|nr:DUF6049 family protein [Streptomyces sp. A3M-1-3]MCP3818114.1 DUF6049 family protein [Streptomyces sp. A3M-1-3]